MGSAATERDERECVLIFVPFAVPTLELVVLTRCARRGVGYLRNHDKTANIVESPWYLYGRNGVENTRHLTYYYQMYCVE